MEKLNVRKLSSPRVLPLSFTVFRFFVTSRAPSSFSSARCYFPRRNCRVTILILATIREREQKRGTLPPLLKWGIENKQESSKTADTTACFTYFRSMAPRTVIFGLTLYWPLIESRNENHHDFYETTISTLRYKVIFFFFCFLRREYEF